MDFRNKPFRYLFLKKYINLKNYKYHKKHSIRDFIEKILMKLDNYVFQNITWKELLKRKNKNGKGKFRIIPRKDVEKVYSSLLPEDDPELPIYKLTIDLKLRVCGIIDNEQAIFYILVCDLDHKINSNL